MRSVPRWKPGGDPAAPAAPGEPSGPRAPSPKLRRYSLASSSSSTQLAGQPGTRWRVRRRPPATAPLQVRSRFRPASLHCHPGAETRGSAHAPSSSLLLAPQRRSRASGDPAPPSYCGTNRGAAGGGFSEGSPSMRRERRVLIGWRRERRCALPIGCGRSASGRGRSEAAGERAHALRLWPDSGARARDRGGGGRERGCGVCGLRSALFSAAAAAAPKARREGATAPPAEPPVRPAVAPREHRRAKRSADAASAGARDEAPALLRAAGEAAVGPALSMNRGHRHGAGSGCLGTMEVKSKVRGPGGAERWPGGRCGPGWQRGRRHFVGSRAGRTRRSVPWTASLFSREGWGAFEGKAGRKVWGGSVRWDWVKGSRNPPLSHNVTAFCGSEARLVAKERPVY